MGFSDILQQFLFGLPTKFTRAMAVFSWGFKWLSGSPIDLVRLFHKYYQQLKVFICYSRYLTSTRHMVGRCLTQLNPIKPEKAKKKNKKQAHGTKCSPVMVPRWWIIMTLVILHLSSYTTRSVFVVSSDITQQLLNGFTTDFTAAMETP